jgi:hypothetical protein
VKEENMPLAVNVDETPLFKQYQDAAKRLVSVIDKSADLGRAEGQHAYVKLCESLASGLRSPAGQRLLRRLTEIQLEYGRRVSAAGDERAD